MLCDLAAAPAFLGLGLNRFSGAWVVAGGVVIAAFMSLGLLEYVLHRWVLHGPPSMARRGHAQHHAEPRALISTPLFVVMTGALAVLRICQTVIWAPGRVCSLMRRTDRVRKCLSHAVRFDDWVPTRRRSSPVASGTRHNRRRRCRPGPPGRPASGPAPRARRSAASRSRTRTRSPELGPPMSPQCREDARLLPGGTKA
jgi:hypothetical protein